MITAKMITASSHMRREINEIPEAVQRLLHHGRADIERVADALRQHRPHYFISVARGSSDHVATYFKYASELLAGTPVASVGPSVASVYNRSLNLTQSACISISQSGRSPDIVAMSQMARARGAISIALTNDADSPLAKVSDYPICLHAGAELSVAATKTFVNSGVAALWMLAVWMEDNALIKALQNLPEVLTQAIQKDWTSTHTRLSCAHSLFCLGRGPSYAIAHEAALKFKETCQVHAEAYSAAEVLHGPVSIVGEGFPVLAFVSADDAEPGVVETIDSVAAKGASAFATSDRVQHAKSLPIARTHHSLADPLSLIASFYAMIEQLARAKGIDPDKPRHLKKITETV